MLTASAVCSAHLGYAADSGDALSHQVCMKSTAVDHPFTVYPHGFLSHPVSGVHPHTIADHLPVLYLDIASDLATGLHAWLWS